MSSPYARAIDTTRDTIVVRARQYKWLVVGVSIAALGLAGMALWLGSAMPLLGWLLLPGAVSAFFALDLRAVHRWRAGILADWRAGQLQMDLLDRTLRQVPALPADTVQGMLELLPAWGPARVPEPARAALVEAQQLVARMAEQRLLWRAAAWTGIVLAAVGAWTAGQPLVALLPPGLLLPLWWALHRRGVARLRASHAALASTHADAPAWLAQMCWQGVPQGLKALCPAKPSGESLRM